MIASIKISVPKDGKPHSKDRTPHPIMIIFTPTAGWLGTVKVVGAIAIARIPIYARLVRGSVLSIKEKEYVESCRALGG